MGKQPFRVALPAARRILGTKKGVIWIFSPLPQASVLLAETETAGCPWDSPLHQPGVPTSPLTPADGQRGKGETPGAVLEVFSLVLDLMGTSRRGS